jgi:hypothetical protein
MMIEMVKRMPGQAKRYGHFKEGSNEVAGSASDSSMYEEIVHNVTECMNQQALNDEKAEP